jgi:hypothetical protein
MEDMLCAMALKSANGRQKHHTQAGLRVCCERALKSAGERTTHVGYRYGGLRETARARKVTLRGGVETWRGSAGYRWRRFGGGGFPPLLANCCPEISARFASSSH